MFVVSGGFCCRWSFCDVSLLFFLNVLFLNSFSFTFLTFFHMALFYLKFQFLLCDTSKTVQKSARPGQSIKYKRDEQKLNSTTRTMNQKNHQHIFLARSELRNAFIKHRFQSGTVALLVLSYDEFIIIFSMSVLHQELLNIRVSTRK